MKSSVQKVQHAEGVTLQSHLMDNPCWQVCVPIDPEKADEFDPVDGVPTVSQLLSQLADQSQPVADAQVGARLHAGP